MLYFCEFYLFSIYFRSLNKFSVISIGRRKSENGETGEQCLGRIRPKASASWSGLVAITAQSTGMVRVRHAWACGHHDCGHGGGAAAIATPVTPLP
jgi:hypothetical protein